MIVNTFTKFKVQLVVYVEKIQSLVTVNNHSY